MKRTLSLLLAALLLLLSSCEAPHTHSFGAWHEVKAATYTENGIEMRECACGESEARTTAKLTPSEPITYTVTYLGCGQSGTVVATAGEAFSIPVIARHGYRFDGYYAGEVAITDGEGRATAAFSLGGDITVEARYTRMASDADTNGEYLGNPNELYYKSSAFAFKMSRNPWDMILYDGILYVGGGYYGGTWVSAPPIETYDIRTGEWDHAALKVRMYEILDESDMVKAWYSLPATSSSSNVVLGGVRGIPVTTDCEISSFRWIGGKPFALGADSINGYTWADGTVSSKRPAEVDAEDTQMSVLNLSGNYYVMETDKNGKDVWVEYRNTVVNGTHVYDVVEIEYEGATALMFAVGTSGTAMPISILADKATSTYIFPTFYLKDGTVYEGNANNRVYNLFSTEEGIFAFYSHQGGTDKKIFKYSVIGGEHRFDEVRDIGIGGTSADTRVYLQADVNASGTPITTRRLYTDYMRTATYHGFAYYTTGYLYKTKSFERDATVAIAAPGGAIVTDLMVKDGVLYALGFKKTDDTEIAYTNYIWSLDDSDRFTEIRSFSTRGAYALSFERDEDFFYVGLGGPTTHITEEVSAVGDILRLAITPIE